MNTTHTQKAPEFINQAMALGLGLYGFRFRHAPAELVHVLTPRIKRTAKLLARALALPRHAALDALARAGKFKDWQHLSRHLAGGESAPDVHPSQFWKPIPFVVLESNVPALPGGEPASDARALPSQWFTALLPLLPLLLEAEDEGVSPEPAQIEAIRGLGERLAAVTGADSALILDEVCAKLAGGRSWTELATRDPLRSAAPLYRFIADDGGKTGEFVLSAAGERLTEELDSHYQEFPGFSAERQASETAWIKGCISTRPDFFEAQLAYAQIRADLWVKEEAYAALRDLTQAVKQAEALMPAGFKGKMSWYQHSNRFYFRMLWLQVQLLCLLREVGKATTVARKILRRCPEDALGVRYVLPLLLLSDGDVAGAARVVTKHLANEDGAETHMLRAFVAYASGEAAKFREQMLTALFDLPWLRLFLDDKARQLPGGDSGFRGVIPDMDLFRYFGVATYYSIPGLREASCALLKEPGVVRAEAKLREVWTARNLGHEGFMVWREALSEQVKRLA